MTALQRSKTAASVRAAEMRVWLCAGALALAGCGADSPAPDAALSDTAGAAVVEAPAPAPAVALLDGTDMPIEAFRGGWLFVNYWAEWCAPCLEEIPELNHLHASSAEVFVLGINFDQLEPEVMRPQVASLGIEFPVAAGDPTAALGLALPEVLPSTFVFDPAGQQVAVLRGPQTLEDLHGAMGGAATERAGDAALGEDLSEPSAGTD